MFSLCPKDLAYAFIAFMALPFTTAAAALAFIAFMALPFTTSAAALAFIAFIAFIATMIAKVSGACASVGMCGVQG